MWQKVKNFLIGFAAGAVALLIFVISQWKKASKNVEAEAKAAGEKAKEDKANELEKMSDSDVVDTLPDPDAVRTGATDAGRSAGTSAFRDKVKSALSRLGSTGIRADGDNRG